jgi:glycosyltransferase involved in cell wall biosynthesis
MFFLLTSDWEDPGFVIVESMISKKIVLSSDCLNGPKELIKNNHNGFLYKQNDIKDFRSMFQKTLDALNENLKNNEILINGYRTTKKFTVFNHYQELKKHMDI